MHTRHWHNQKTGVYCLVEAPSIIDAIRVHKEAHGLVADQLIEVTIDQGRSFFGCSETHPLRDRSEDGGFRVVMFTDIADSTTLTCQLGDQRLLRLNRFRIREKEKSMSDDKEKMIENVSVSPETQPEAVEDELSDADLEYVAGASLAGC